MMRGIDADPKRREELVARIPQRRDRRATTSRARRSSLRAIAAAYVTGATLVVDGGMLSRL